VGLEIYRHLFEASDVQAGVAAVAEAMEEYQRWLNLTAAVIRCVEHLQKSEGAVDQNDLYWNIRRNEQFNWVTRDDIRRAMEAVVTPGLGLLRGSGDGFKTLGSLKTAAARLRLLADRILEE